LRYFLVANASEFNEMILGFLDLNLGSIWSSG
jgi:hypothetical protein